MKFVGPDYNADFKNLYIIEPYKNENLFWKKRESSIYCYHHFYFLFFIF